MRTYEFKMYIRVHDKQALFDAALRHALGVDGLSTEQALGELRTDGAIDVEACIQMLLDPGSGPAGTSIDESMCGCVHSTEPPDECITPTSSHFDTPDGVES